MFFCCNLDDYEKRAASPKYFWLTFCVYVKRELAAVSLGLDLAFLFDMTYEVDWALKTTYSREKQFCVVGKRETRVCDRTEESGSGI